MSSSLSSSSDEEEDSDSESDDDLLDISSSPSLSSTADDLADILRPSSSPATSTLLRVSSMVGLVRPSDVSLFVIVSFVLEISSVASFVAAADLDDLPPTLRDGAGEAPPALLLAPAAGPLRRERAMVAGLQFAASYKIEKRMRRRAPAAAQARRPGRRRAAFAKNKCCHRGLGSRQLGKNRIPWARTATANRRATYRYYVGLVATKYI